LHYIDTLGGDGQHDEPYKNLLKLWFKLPQVVNLNKLTIHNNQAAIEFDLKPAGNMADESGTAILEHAENDNSSATKFTEVHPITTTVTSMYYFLEIKKWSIYKQYFQATEIEFEYTITLSPPTVTFPSSPVEEENATVGVVLGSGATQWEYRLDNGNWTTGTGNSFQLPVGTYEYNTQNQVY
jgi:hypothetical protein